MGGWLNILALGDLEKLNRHLRNDLKTLKKMTEEKILLPIEDVAEENKWKKNNPNINISFPFKESCAFTSFISSRIIM